MPFWGQLNLQEGSSVVMELLNYFHDYMMMLLLMVLVFVTYLFIYLSMNSLLDKFSVDSHFLETVWTVIPMFVLLLMAFPSLYLLYLMEDVCSSSVVVKVIGHQWYWEYQITSFSSASFDSYMVYSGEGSFAFLSSLDVDNRLCLPSMCSLNILITSADVLHSWAVPSLGLKADACPGRLNSLTTLVPFCGVYYGQCSEICGSNHSFMPIVIEVVSTTDFVSTQLLSS